MRTATVRLGDELVEAEYDYQPMEQATLEYPGCDAGASLTSAKLNDVEILQELSQECIERMEEECLL